MSSAREEFSYRCWNDCRPEGCPSHTATIDYQSVSEALVLQDGKGQKFYIQTPELQAFLTMLRRMAKYRVEISSALTSDSPDGEEASNE